jgi:DNA-binding response OmpR family regulator
MKSPNAILKGKHVLIVEDDRYLADVLARLVRQHGIRVTHAESGTKTLDVLKQEYPDLMLLDLGLPDMSGLDLVTQVRWDEKTKSIPILAMSGNPTEERKCLRTGCNDFILKPFDASQLLERISGLLSRTD